MEDLVDNGQLPGEITKDEFVLQALTFETVSFSILTGSFPVGCCRASQANTRTKQRRTGRRTALIVRVITSPLYSSGSGRPMYGSGCGPSESIRAFSLGYALSKHCPPITHA
jgi:hypothetical protein